MARKKALSARASRIARRGMLAIMASIAMMASMLAVPVAFAQEEGETLAAAAVSVQSEGTLWDAPHAALSTDDSVVTAGSHLSATATAELLGLNGTVLPGQQVVPHTLDEALALNRLGVFGTDINASPNPYLYNLLYDFYADANELEKSSESAVVDTQTKAHAYVFYAADNEAYATTSDLALRPDIVIGVSGVPGRANELKMNQATTDALNFSTWGSGLGIPSQPYQFILDIRHRTNDESLVGTRNSDGNLYEWSDFYRSGDETYDPIAVVYDRGTSVSGIDYAVENANNLAWAAKLALQQDPGKTTRYGDPLAIASSYELYAKAIKWSILSRIQSGELQKKKVALVVRVKDGGFILAKMNPDGDSTNGYRVIEAVQDTVDDLAAEYFPAASAGIMRQTVTAEQLMAADVVICMPQIASTYLSSAADVRAALSAAGFEEGSAGYPAIMDDVYPLGTATSRSDFEGSVEGAMLVGLVQGFIYPEVVNPVEAAAYYARNFFHLKDEYVEPFVRSQLEGMSLPTGVTLDTARYGDEGLAAVQQVIDQGEQYYFDQGGKAVVDAARPRIASSDALDDKHGVGVSTVSVTAPEGATVKMVDEHRLDVAANVDGTFAIDDDDESTVIVSLKGYRDYTRSVKGSDGAIVVSVDEMVRTKTVTFHLPDGAVILLVKNALNLAVRPNDDGTYTLDDGVEADFTISLAGYDDYVGTIAPNATEIVLTTADFTPESTLTRINVPSGATLVVTDAKGAKMAAEIAGYYRLFNGYSYKLKVTHPRYEDYTLDVLGGEKDKIDVRLANMTAYVGHVELTIDKKNVAASDIRELDAEVVQTLTLGPSVRTVAAGAFKNCPNLTTVIFGEGVTSVGASAFQGLSKLSSVSFNYSLKSIGTGAFSGCTSLTKVTVPASVKTLGAKAFYGCTKLSSAKVGNGVANLGASTFAKCKNLTTLWLGTGLKTIGASAFAGCVKLSSVSVPTNVTAIGDSAFSGCTKLSSMSLNKRLATIGKTAFANCASLADLTLPEGVKTIKPNAFSGCKKLTMLTVKTTLLAKAGVKKAFVKSSVKTVLVRVGKAKVNRKYANMYKKIFTKKICGVKVNVRS